MERTREEWEEIVNTLMKDITRATRDRNQKACDHVTLRPPYLPCPAPECFGLDPKHKLRIMRYRDTPGLRYALDPKPHGSDIEEEVWQRFKFDMQLNRVKDDSKESWKLYGWERVDNGADEIHSH